jgi:hypothetical protein
MDGWLIVFLVYFLISIIYILSRSDSKEECKTNFPALKETQAECLEAYPTTGPITKSQCKTTFPELMETKAECLAAHPNDLMETNSQGINIPDCPTDMKHRDPNCSAAATGETTPITETTCVQGYTSATRRSPYAYKCKWNTAADRGGTASCDSWNMINNGQLDPDDPPELCRIPQ